MFNFRSSKTALVRWLSSVVLGCLVFVTLPAQCSEYDDIIKSSWRRYLPQYHWGVGWAQMMQESAGRADAVSPVGAEGLAQFMPATWSDMIKAGIVPPGTPRRDARYSLQAQAYYMRQLTRIWSSKRSDGDRIRLALASYNGGAGDLIKSQKLCGGPVQYDAIMVCLHLVSGKSEANVRENRSYVPHIERHYKRRFGYAMD